MIKMFFLSIGGIFVAFTIMIPIYFVALFSDTIALLFLEYWPLIYTLAVSLFSVFHGASSAKTIKKCHWVSSLLNGIILGVPLLFVEKIFLASLTLIFSFGVSFLATYTYIPLLLHKKMMDEKEYDNISNPDDYAILLKLISDYEKDKKHDEENNP